MEDFKKGLFDLIQKAEKDLELKQKQLNSSDIPNKAHVQGQINNVIDKIFNYKSFINTAVYSNETIDNFSKEAKKIEEQIRKIKI